ncbi:MAG: hypothetical protein ABSH49_32870 [Bryobacteraceae bacterium]|jgi:hypothetical protein
MEAALILADRILGLIRDSGATEMEAYSALEVAHKVVRSIDDMAVSRPPAPVSETAELR